MAKEVQSHLHVNAVGQNLGGGGVPQTMEGYPQETGPLCCNRKLGLKFSGLIGSPSYRRQTNVSLDWRMPGLSRASARPNWPLPRYYRRRPINIKETPNIAMALP